MNKSPKKPKPAPKVTVDELWAAIEEATKDKRCGTIRPVGSFTAAEYSKQFGLSVAAACYRIDRAFREGKLDREKIWVSDDYNRNRPTWCYTLKKK